MTKTGKIFTTYSIDAAVMTNPIDYKDGFNRKDVSSAFYNNIAPDKAKTTISRRFNANKHIKQTWQICPIHRTILFFWLNSMSFLMMIFSLSVKLLRKQTTKLQSSPHLCIRQPALWVFPLFFPLKVVMLLGEDNVKSSLFSSLLTSAMLIPNLLIETPEASGLGRESSA